VPLVEKPEIWADIQRKYAATGREVTKTIANRHFCPRALKFAQSDRLCSRHDLAAQTRFINSHFSWCARRDADHVATDSNRLAAIARLSNRHFFSRVLLYWGISESKLAEQVQHLFASQNPTLAPYANYGQARLRITACAADQAAAEQLIAPFQAEILSLTGNYCYGSDNDTLASVVGQHLHQHQQTLAVAESCTGGWLGQMITEVPGSSTYFLGGIISYSNVVKVNLLNVSDDLADYGAVSAQVAEQMAIGVKQKLDSDWGLSITGIAGPDGGTAQKPVGLVYLGLADPQGEVVAIEARFSPSKGRNWVRRLSACSALDLLRQRFVMIGV
jgi:nicotinamide-nucleotide amidase